MTLRKIIHIDMDAFFAAVEQRDHPELRGKAIAVGYDGPRGVVATASYEARKYGVHSAMSVVKAKKLCPHLLIIPGHMSVYKAVSDQVMEIFREYTDVIEPLSIDEAFLDVTENKAGIPLAVTIAKEIKQKVRERLHLVASAGVSYNKFLAKIASDYRKPDGLCTIHPSRALDFIAQLPIEKFWGVGPVTAKKMHALGVKNGADLRALTKQQLQMYFGKVGSVYYDFARGIDERSVQTFRIRKSIGCEHTLLEDISDPLQVEEELRRTVQELLGRLQRHPFQGYTLTLKVKFHDFEQITRSFTADEVIQGAAEIERLAFQLLREVDYAQHPIRLMGLSISNAHSLDSYDYLPGEWRQLSFNFVEEAY